MARTMATMMVKLRPPSNIPTITSGDTQAIAKKNVASGTVEEQVLYILYGTKEYAFS